MSVRVLASDVRTNNLLRPLGLANRNTRGPRFCSLLSFAQNLNQQEVSFSSVSMYLWYNNQLERLAWGRSSSSFQIKFINSIHLMPATKTITKNGVDLSTNLTDSMQGGAAAAPGALNLKLIFLVRQAASG